MSSVRKTWRVEGMHCVHCETAIERALSSLPGLSEVHASYRKGTVTALWNAQRLPERSIAQRLRMHGYALARKRRTPVWAECLKLLLLAAGLFGLYWLMSQTAVAGWMSAFPVARAGMSLGMLFMVGLMTSLHCVAMCGGINIAQSAKAAQGGRRPDRANFMYNLGRVVSYTAIGGVVGAVGSAFSISATAKACIQVIAAGFMLIMALNLMGGFSWLKRFSLSLPRGLSDRLQKKGFGRSSFAIGLANGLMPCGPLQSMQLFALSTGSWWMGALSMLCFSLGTVPLMLGIGLVGGRLNRKYGRPMRVVSAALVLLMGMNMLVNGLALAGVGVGSTNAGKDGYATIRGDKQYVRSEIDYGTYPSITVQAGIPVEWTIVAEESKLNGCNNEIVLSAYDLTVPLQVGENAVEFTPGEAGTVLYTCWMGMIRGSIHVVDSLQDALTTGSTGDSAEEALLLSAGSGCCSTGVAFAAGNASAAGGCCGTGATSAAEDAWTTGSTGDSAEEALLLSASTGCCSTGVAFAAGNASAAGGCCGAGAPSAEEDALPFFAGSGCCAPGWP